ncbi:ABC transporter permease [Sediminibacterium ginsengisoli]|uniref:Duplicated orphan permease n=1 Tax=Sediminibacterium ginsengisoli TaxID=413434 RepID=A0A1T4PJ75_9BACT|nr:ABC transporter permease [Sediminibacterium ginsengisoli]SJZ91337.1 duplicated orphan permease [Sediminibacterium ginsengisoli]
MLKNYFVTAFRNLARNKSFLLINVAGLTIGIASCLLIFLVIRFELSFDDYHAKKDRIYRVTTVFDRSGGLDYSSGVSVPVAQALRVDYPQLEVANMMSRGNDMITVLEDGKPVKKFRELKGVFFTEPQVFKIFDNKWLAGDPATAITDPFTAALSRSLAVKYFGSWQQAVGKSIVYEKSQPIKITGVFEDVPENSDYPFGVVISQSSNRSLMTNTDWQSTTSDQNCIIVLPENMSAAQFNNMLIAFRKKHAPESSTTLTKISYHLQPLNEIHFDERFGTYNERTFSKELIRGLALIAAFLLIIACVNFINLSTAQAVNRSKEVGIRKVLGGTRRQLVFQFMGETFIITFIAACLATVVTWLMLPFLSDLMEVSITPGAGQIPQLLLFLVAVIVCVTFLSGFYPALILSGFNPISALKSKLSAKSIGGLSLRRVLVVLQFGIAQVLIIATLVVISQMNFFRSTSLGFNQQAVLNIPLPADSVSHSKRNIVRERLMQQPGISNVSYSFSAPADFGAWSSDFNFDHSPVPINFEPSLKWADTGYFSTYGLQMVAGRPYIESDTTREFVVNETLVRKLGLKSPEEALGKEINFWDGRIVAPIVGVVKDFHSNSLKDEMNPVVMGTRERSYRMISVRIDMSKSKELLAKIEKIWNESFPDYVYEYQFMDEKIRNFYRQENQLSQLYKVFAGIAIFISCLGLYGLVSFMAVQRTKEVGIRKVLGASAANIIYLFSKEFTLLISISFLIAAPLAYYFMRDWLNKFVFRIDMGIWFFVVSIAGSLCIAWITVGYRAAKAAFANPVNSLRNE